jgi:hypothetical protein
MFIPQMGIRLKHRPTGVIFEVTKITRQFVILSSMNGFSDIMLEKKSSAFLSEFEEPPPAEFSPGGLARNLYGEE